MQGQCIVAMAPPSERIWLCKTSIAAFKRSSQIRTSEPVIESFANIFFVGFAASAAWRQGKPHGVQETMTRRSGGVSTANVFSNAYELEFELLLKNFEV
ncbi:hypothetical protein [Novipirellula maiorica]|uniref:hypothetical protein n=1 Tax=Novipirellula maiorica TaxID=1265734 RepID=UPI000592A7B9|nr:hypothetical protein [Rhodopirellula maiorica]